MSDSLKEKEFVASRLQLGIAIWRSLRLFGTTQKIIWACSIKQCRLRNDRGQVLFVIGPDDGKVYRLVGKA